MIINIWCYCPCFGIFPGAVVFHFRNFSMWKSLPCEWVCARAGGSFCDIVLFCFNFWILFLVAFVLFVFSFEWPHPFHVVCRRVLAIAFKPPFACWPCSLCPTKFVCCPYCTRSHNMYAVVHNMGHQNRFHAISTLVWMLYSSVCLFAFFIQKLLEL